MGIDLNATNGTLTIPSPQLTGTIRVQAVGDSDDEFPFEDFYVNLSNSLNATIVDGQGVGVITDDDAVPVTKTWNGTGNWNEGGNWAPTGVPRAVDDVILASGTVTLSNAVTVAAVTVGNSVTLVFTNWPTKMTVDGNVEVQSGGTITLPAGFTDSGPSNRVWIACSNLLLAAGASIDADEAGFLGGLNNENGHGPGGGGWGGYSAGGGYGGRGGKPEEQYYAAAAGVTYGSATDPAQPGSGGGVGNNSATRAGAGGGAVKINAAGTVTVNGTITANGGNAPTDSSNRFGGGGSGGGVSIACNVFAGTNGLISAQGGDRGYGGYGGGGGGGRIAINYNPPSQASAGQTKVKFNVNRGLDGRIHPTYPQLAELGTLYFPDYALLDGTWMPHSGELRVPSASLSLDSLTVSNGWLRFPGDGFTLTVANDLTVTGVDGVLDIGGDALAANRFGHSWQDLKFYVGHTVGPVVRVGGNVSLAGGGELRVYSGLDNPAVPGWGSVLAVTGDVSIASGSTLQAWSHPTNGAGVRLNMEDLDVSVGGLLHADKGGYGGGNPASRGYGPGGGPAGGSYTGGGGHGGRGSEGNIGRYGGNVCGTDAGPIAGSGGGGGNGVGGAGGGLLRIAAGGTVTIDGSVTADGDRAGEGGDTTWTGGGHYCGAGAGGGVHISCTTFEGTGLVRVKGGGPGYNGHSGVGAGGRIVVAYNTGAQATVSPQPTVTFEASPSTGGHLIGSDDPCLAEMGTLWFSDWSLVDGRPLDHTGKLLVDGATSWKPASLVVSNGWVRFPVDGFELDVTNDIVVTGSGARLELGGSLSLTNWTPNKRLFLPYSEMTNPPVLRCADLSLSQGGSVHVYSSLTNGSNPEYGALLDVGDLIIATNSWLYLYSHPTNGGSALCRVNNLDIESPNAGISAQGRGFSGSWVSQNGYGYGNGFGGTFASGAGHGGAGGQSNPAYPETPGSTYGSSNAPAHPGSNGGAGSTSLSSGGMGGGVVRIVADRAITLNGTITADGVRPRGGSVYRGGGGSGGSIYLTATVFAGTGGLLSADGAAGGDLTWGGPGGDGGGGGGRIAVWRKYDGSSGVTASVNGGTGYETGGVGTVVWGQTPIPGSIFLIR